MKRLLCVVLVLCMVLSCLTVSVGATVDNAGRTVRNSRIYTPRGTAVTASVTAGDLTDGERAAAESVEEEYTALGAVCLGDASLRYNCHTYAWAERDTDLASVWIDSVGSYIQDGSYVRIDEPEVGCIVLYYSTMSIDYVEIQEDGSEITDSIISIRSYTHSGVVTEVPENSKELSDITVVSKWGRAGLFSHKGDVCPYVMEVDTAERWYNDTSLLRGRDGFSDVEYYRFNADNYSGLTMRETGTQFFGVKNGLWHDADGEIRYYVKGTAQYVGLVSDSSGNFYYIGEDKKAVRGESCLIDRFRANRLLPTGIWTFGEDGILVGAPTLLAGDDLLNGLVQLSSGIVQYLQNGEPTSAGLVQSDSGEYYFIGPSRQAFANTTCTIPEKYTNGLLPAGTYSFDSAGCVAVLPELLAGDDCRNGLVRMPDGTVQYLKSGVKSFAGLVQSDAGDYYFIAPNGLAVANTQYGFSTQYANGLLPSGIYTFDETGKIAQLPELLGGESLVNGLVRLPGGSVRYLKDGEPTFAGLVQSATGDYYFIGSSLNAIAGTRYTFSSFYSNGLLPAGTYTFDETGKIAQLPELLGGQDYMNGLVRMPNGRIQFFENGTATAAGLVQSSTGDYYFIGNTKRASTNAEISIDESKTNGLLPAGTYLTDATGKLIVEAETETEVETETETEAETETVTEAETEVETDSETETETESETETVTEAETEVETDSETETETEAETEAVTETETVTEAETQTDDITEFETDSAKEVAFEQQIAA